MRYSLLVPLFSMLLLASCGKDDPEPDQTPEKLGITYVYVGSTALSAGGTSENVALNEPVEIKFDKAVNTASAQQNIRLQDANNQEVAVTFTFFSENQLVKLTHDQLAEGAMYTLKVLGGLKGENNETFDGQTFNFETMISPLFMEAVLIDDSSVNPLSRIQNISRNPQITLQFSSQVLKDDIALYSDFSSGTVAIDFSLNQVDERTISVSANQTLAGLAKYRFTISSNLENRIGKPFAGLDLNFYTEVDPAPKFPLISDDELLTKVQEQTFRYFWDFGHPVSGLARERNTSGETVTIGGSGFGVMAILVGIERGFITRAEGVDRLKTMVDFLGKADRFHGAWSHWLNGSTGKALPFSQKDNGGDLVETSFMAAGLLAARQYLNPANTAENLLIGKIDELWKSIEWDWYTQGRQNVLYWHWSPDYGWDMNMKIQGYNEALITYIMAASSTTHSVSADVYHQGWARNGSIENGKEFYGIRLPVGYDYGGPLFFAHYSFLGIDPRDLSDQYADYWEQNRNHSLINRGYCIENNQQYVGYSAECWGLTASDNHQGYSAHSPTNDLGVITPTAALSSMPFTPEESLDALRFFYYQLGDRLWGEYGFYDAFNLTESWTASSFLAIDQGPIVVMIENYRSQLIWNLLMSHPDVQNGLKRLGFSSPHLK
ncbi:glucoamylase family protein [Gaoshiqia sediminis]|uniref:Ig-like domain-containing protein n=1 Tax=Gaoshiqia sediminis TaxID=2986998 RepID=A0AA41Y8W6_9BACT|nr:glucoamylase family protein [Gaoshiqia sediminis]MCW0483746.1 Ig-like domain-containing protein [Gaoshiqia sediminis]